MNLIIAAHLTEPPSSLMSFRSLTMYAKNFNLSVLLETEREMIDKYFKYLDNKKQLDFVDDILTVGEESGLRIDTSNNFKNTIITKRINDEEVLRLVDILTYKIR